MVFVNTCTKNVNIYNIKNNLEDYYYDNNNPILTYNYNYIFIGGHEFDLQIYGVLVFVYSSNESNKFYQIYYMTRGIGNNIYVYISIKIKVFKTLANIINHKSLFTYKQ
jgi:hypothetical protein